MKKRLSPEHIQLLKDELCTELAEYLADDYKLTPQEAIDLLYTSETFERIQDDDTGLYYQSSGYKFFMIMMQI